MMSCKYLSYGDGESSAYMNSWVNSVESYTLGTDGIEDTIPNILQDSSAPVTSYLELGYNGICTCAFQDYINFNTLNDPWYGLLLTYIITGNSKTSDNSRTFKISDYITKSGLSTFEDYQASLQGINYCGVYNFNIDLPNSIQITQVVGANAANGTRLIGLNVNLGSVKTLYSYYKDVSNWYGGNTASPITIPSPGEYYISVVGGFTTYEDTYIPGYERFQLSLAYPDGSSYFAALEGSDYPYQSITELPTIREGNLPTVNVVFNDSYVSYKYGWVEVNLFKQEPWY